VGLLDYILSIKAGVPYGELVKERILDVLGMDSTRIAMNSTATVLSDALKSRLAKVILVVMKSILNSFQKQSDQHERCIPLQMTY
jgi:CubicO group peptidase (beta-lactamase class C family)